MKIRTLLSALALTALAATAETHTSIAGHDVAIWTPAGPAPPSGYPVILFSHGYGGCNTQSKFLMEALAEAGYLVVATNHNDARWGTAGKGTGWYPGKFLSGARPEEPFQKPETWTDQTYRDRRDDMRGLLDAVLRARSFQGAPVDSTRVGVAGHSLGGYTALGIGGAWPSWKDDRIKAVLALSAYVNPYIQKGDLPGLDIPVMYQGGTRDLGITPAIRRFNGAYDLSSAPKYYVEFDGAGHLAWTNLNPAFQGTIDTYSVAFFDRYLKGGTAHDPLTPLFGAVKPKQVSLARADSIPAKPKP